MAQKRKLSDAIDSSKPADKPDKKARTDQDAPASSALTPGEKRQLKSEQRAKKGKQGKNAVSRAEMDRRKAEKKAAKREKLANRSESKYAPGTKNKDKYNKNKDRNKERQTSKKTSMSTSDGTEQASPPPPTTTSTAEPSDDDAVAAGSDFVPLSDTEPTEEPLSTKPPSEFQLKARAEKQERKAGKAAAAAAEAEAADESKAEAAKHRFIAFIGNLPFSTTTESLEKHLSGVAPFKLRHSTEKGTGKSRGFAFVEFENYDRMKTCLKLYHHSYFNPANPTATEEADGAAWREGGRDKKKAKKDKGRRINVELTAGGGGKSVRRVERIQQKNQKLAEQRERAAKQMQEKRKQPKETNGNEASKDDGGDGDNGNASGNIHPSRMRIVKHG